MENGKISIKAAKRKAKRAAKKAAVRAVVGQQVAAAERAAAGKDVGTLKRVARFAVRTAGIAARRRGAPGKRDRGVIRPVARRINVDSIAQALMAPRQYYPERMALELAASGKTAVSHPHAQVNAPWDTTNPATMANRREVLEGIRAAELYVGKRVDRSKGKEIASRMSGSTKQEKSTPMPLAELAPGEMFALVTRKAQCATIMKRNDGAHYNYDLWLSIQNPGSPPTVPAIVGVQTAAGAYIYPVFGTPNTGDLTQVPIHGPLWYGASSNGEENDAISGAPARYFFIEQGGVMAFTSSTSTSANVFINYCDGRTVDGNIDAINWSSTTGGTYTVPKTGYYTFLIEPSTPTSDWQASIGGGGASVTTFAHLPLPNLVDLQSTADAVRVTAASVQYTNTAPLLDLQGKIAQYQYPAGTNWIDKLVKSASAYDQVASENDSWNDRAKKGSFAFLKPANIQDFELTTHLRVDENQNLIDSYWPIMDNSSFVVTVISIDEPDGRGGYFEFAYGVEFQTTNVWFDTENARATPDDYKVALEVIRVLNQYYCNPLHLSQIINGIKSVGTTLFGAVRKYGPAVNNLIREFSPAAAKVGGAVLKGLDAFASEADL